MITNESFPIPSDRQYNYPVRKPALKTGATFWSEWKYAQQSTCAFVLCLIAVSYARRDYVDTAMWLHFCFEKLQITSK